MRRIQKGPPPAAIAELRRTPGATWVSVHGDQKAAMREAARREQRGLCAYCNQRVWVEGDATMEHWVPRSDPSCDPFAWEHLLLVCAGGQAAAPHCDRRRGDQPLTLHPARPVPDPEAAARYLADGRVTSADPGLERELDQVLGLNAPLLQQQRKHALTAVLDELRRDRSAAGVRHLLAAYQREDGDLPPHPRAVLPTLERALRQAEGRARRTRSTR
ncbi:hypothetical protein L6R53_07610 [Myxococcota bacterium]|nr:hypothetical protein [Myxococcota bacterium]